MAPLELLAIAGRALIEAGYMTERIPLCIDEAQTAAEELAGTVRAPGETARRRLSKASPCETSCAAEGTRIAGAYDRARE